MSADRLISLFAEGLGAPPENLSDESSPDNTPEWDSLAGMQMVALIEDTFGIRLSTREIMTMRAIGVARQVLRGKKVPL